MFIVQRKLNQSVEIGEGAKKTTISIVKIGQNSVKLCIDAPEGMKITRVVEGESMTGKSSSTKGGKEEEEIQRRG